MFGLGFFEILVIFLVVIIFVNPKDLPGFFRRVGRVVRQLRDIRDSSVRYMRRIEREIEGQRPPREQADDEPQQPDGEPQQPER